MSRQELLQEIALLPIQEMKPRTSEKHEAA